MTDSTSKPFGLRYGTSISRIWSQQAELAELLRHSATAGGLRETFVRDFLGRFLPSSVSVGTGQIMDGGGGISRQQDIILYRANFPVFHLYGQPSLYIVEGVLGTVEVKTSLDNRTLSESFQNIASVRALRDSAGGVEALGAETSSFEPLRDFGSGEPVENAIRRMDAADAEKSAGEDPLDGYATERIYSYIVAFSGPVQLPTLVANTNHAHQQHSQGIPDFLCVNGRYAATRKDVSEQVFLLQSSVQEDCCLTIEEAGDDTLGLLLATVWHNILCRRSRLPLLRPYWGVRPKDGP